MFLLRVGLSLLFLLFGLLPAIASAEILHGVFLLDSLKAVKQKYPNGQFSRVNSAWVTEAEAFYQMTGTGFPGTLFVAFNDVRPLFKKNLAEKCGEPISDQMAESCKSNRSLANQNEDDALSVKWVRWVPAQPIPLERYMSKYGEPTKFGFDKDTMIPYAQWDTAALSAELSDDKKMVLFVTTSFTRSETRAAWLRTVGFVPDFLKDEPTPKVPPEQKDKPRAPLKKIL